MKSKYELFLLEIKSSLHFPCVGDSLLLEVYTVEYVVRVWTDRAAAAGPHKLVCDAPHDASKSPPDPFLKSAAYPAAAAWRSVCS